MASQSNRRYRLIRRYLSAALLILATSCSGQNFAALPALQNASAQNFLPQTQNALPEANSIGAAHRKASLTCKLPTGFRNPAPNMVLNGTGGAFGALKWVGEKTGWTIRTGVDLADRRSPVYAIADGVVVESGRRPGLGLSITVRHAGGIESLYAHLRKSLLRGHRVFAGQQIAVSGAWGLTFGISNGSPIDPCGSDNTAAATISVVGGVDVTSVTLDGTALAAVPGTTDEFSTGPLPIVAPTGNATNPLHTLNVKTKAQCQGNYSVVIEPSQSGGAVFASGSKVAPLVLEDVPNGADTNASLVAYGSAGAYERQVSRGSPHRNACSTDSPSPSPSPSSDPSASPDPTTSPVSTDTPAPTPTASPVPTPTPTPRPTPTPTPVPTPTPTPRPTPIPTPISTPTPTPTDSPTPRPTPTPTPVPTPTPTPRPTPTPTPVPTPPPPPTPTPGPGTTVWQIGDTWGNATDGQCGSPTFPTSSSANFVLNRNGTSCMRNQLNPIGNGGSGVYRLNDGQTYSFKFQTVTHMGIDSSDYTQRLIFQIHQYACGISPNTVLGIEHFPGQSQVWYIQSGGQTFTLPYTEGGTDTWQLTARIANDSTGTEEWYHNGNLVASTTGSNFICGTNPFFNFGPYMWNWVNQGGGVSDLTSVAILFNYMQVTSP